MAKRKFVRTRLLKEGMKVDERIIDRLGRTLVAKGAVLDDYIIRSLERLGVLGIYIQIEEDQEVKVSKKAQEVIDTNKVEDRSKVKLTESIKKRVSVGMQYLYNNTSGKEFSKATKYIADDLMRAVLEHDTIAIDIHELKVSDEYTFKHSVDVATMAMVIAKQIGMPQNCIYEIGISGLLHDIGKSKIPNEVLNKPGKLTDEEFIMMKKHTLYGYDILKDKTEISDAVRLGVLQHHEKLNGKGYPSGISEDYISPYAKILSVVDIYDALVTERPYKVAYTQRTAVELLMSMTSELDIQAMKAFMQTMILYPVNSVVRLSNGELAKVVENHFDCIMRPKVVEVRTGKVYDLAKDVKCANLVIL